MDVDLTKPLYIFVVSLSGSVEPASLPKNIVRRCSQSFKDPIELTSGKPAIAIRGSSFPFGFWSEKGICATEISKGLYHFILCTSI